MPIGQYSLDADDLAAMLGPWSPAPAEAAGLKGRLALSLRHLIESGLLPAGSRLPPERAMALALHVSRPTVSAVMAELRALGLVESRQGSGTTVASPPAATAAAAGTGSSWPPFLEIATPSGVINLAAATPFDASHLGDVSLAAADLLTTSPPSGLDGWGLVRLRQAIAERFTVTEPRCEVGPDQVVPTSGAHQALAMIVTQAVPSGGRLLAESLTYGGLVDIANTRQLPLVTLERDTAGPDPDDLDTKLTRYRPDLVVLVANLHSPTGRSVPSTRLDELAEVLDRHGTLTVADGTYDELTFGIRVPGLASRCRHAEVITIGSLSKIGWSGLRIGWLVTSAAQRARDLVRTRSAAWDFGPSVPSQLIGLQVLERLDDIGPRRSRRLAALALVVADELAEWVPSWKVVRPDGGLSLWIELPVEDATPFVEQAYRAGVAVLAGSASRADRGPDPHLRLCFDRPDHLLAEALDRLTTAWHD